MDNKTDVSTARRCGARNGQLRRYAKPSEEHLHQEGREEEDVRVRQGRALEYGDQDLSRRQPILDLWKGNFSETTGLQPRFPALQVLRIIRGHGDRLSD